LLKNNTTEKVSNEAFLETEIEVVVRQDLGHMRDLGDKETQQFPLLTRAWPYKEGMLTPGIAHFCEDEFIWECCKLRTCECGSNRTESKQKTGKYSNLTY